MCLKISAYCAKHLMLEHFTHRVKPSEDFWTICKKWKLCVWSDVAHKHLTKQVSVDGLQTLRNVWQGSESF